MPPLLGYLLAGIAVGPFTLGFVADQRLTAELAEIGVALLLFGVGIHFSLADLVAVWRIAIPGALLQVAISTAVGFVAAVLLVGRKLIPWVLAWTARDGSRELFRLAVIVVALGVAYGSAELAGVSLALGAFFAGVVLAESDLSHQAAAESVPIQQVFTVLFFVSVGMLFDLAVLLRAPAQVFALVVTILLGTGLVTLVTLLGLRTPFAIAALVAAALAQIGEFSFILTGLAVKDGLLPSEGRDLVLAASLLTIVASPFVFRAAETLGSRVEELPRVRGWQAGRTVARARAEIPPLSHHAIVVGHGRVGSVVAAALRQQGVPYVVVEQNLALARGLRREGVPVVYGDAGWPEVLVAAHPEPARLLVIAIPEGGQVRRIVQTAREANPHLRVIVRTHSDAEAEWLHAQAIERVVMSERRTAMEIAEHAIKSFEEIVQAPPPGGPAAAAGRASSDRREPGTTKTARTRS